MIGSPKSSAWRHKPGIALTWFLGRQSPVARAISAGPLSLHKAYQSLKHFIAMHLTET
jgi:hypothetical protein